MPGIADFIGVYSLRFQLGLNGLGLKSAASKIRARNAADSADAPLVGSVIAASGDSIQINEDATGAAADWLYSLNRPAAGMTAAVALTLPTTAGSPGQVMTTDGAGALTFTTVAGGADKPVTDTTTLAFGSGASLSLFTLPANAVVQQVKVIVDTAFSGAPSVSIGIAGTTSKYMASNQIDLTQVLSYTVSPDLVSVGTTENLIATYAAGGAAAGSARILVTYVIPS